MNKAEKATIKAHLNAEQKALQELEKAYKQAKKDCQERIKALNARTDMQNLQTIVHQRKYQQVLLKQIDGVLNDLQTHTYQSANEFFQSAYENGYVGSMYEFIYQDIPLTIPISRKKMLTAIQTDSKISKDYYLKQGLTVQNIRTLKQQIAQEATRGIASGKSWLEVANSLSIQRYFSISLSDAMRICRTEGNRINQQARLDAGDEAIKAGCDLLKQWDATMDDKTRPWHREADGQIVEWNESFTVMGEKLKAPSIGGSAKNVINCRCQLLKRPRWALDEEELERLKKRADYFGLDKSQSFEEYKQKFLNVTTPVTFDWGAIPKESAESYEKTFKMLSEKYPLRNRPVSWVGDFRISNGYDLDEDFIDLTDRETQWTGVGARFMPSSRFSPKPYIEIVDPETSVGEANEYFDQLLMIRKTNGWHGKQNSFFNMVGNTSTTMIHEYGHAVAYDCGLYGSAKTAEPLWELFRSTSSEEIGKQLSIYASSSPNEMLAEAFAQSFAPEELQSDLCKQIMEMIRKARGDM